MSPDELIAIRARIQLMRIGKRRRGDMGFTGVTISGPDTLRYRAAKAIWEKRPDCQGKVWPLETPTSVRAYLHNPVASIDLSFIYADAVLELLFNNEIDR